MKTPYFSVGRVLPVLFVSTLLASSVPAFAKASSHSVAKVVSAPVNIELAHQLGPDKGAQLARIVERFNAQSKLGQIVLADQPWQADSTAQLAIIDSGDETPLVAEHRFKPLWQVMKEAHEPLKVAPAPRFMVPAVLDEAGHPRALPVGLSTPVVFFNKDALRKVGVNLDDIPKTWNGWQDVLGKLAQNGQTCPMTASYPVSSLLENAGAWNNQAFVVGGKNEQIAVNGLVQVMHLAKLSTWYKASFLRLFGRDAEGEAHFASGECSVLVAPSSAFPTLVRSAAFPVGVSSYPYHDDAYGAPQNTWADGPAMWVAAGRTPAEYRLVAAFVNFWLEPQNQADWEINAGYLPLSQSGLVQIQPLPHSATPDAQRIAIGQLTYKPASVSSTASAYGHRRGVRRVLAEEMEQVFASKKPAKQGLDDAVQRIRSGAVN
jgi:sn-glycerol 3-phosphate transport system substrate-binding protein